MKKTEPTEFRQMIPAAKAASGDAVYPLSVAEGIQSGEIYTSEHAVLFLHQCGFAYISGQPDSAFLSDTEERMRTAAAQQQRFLLISEDPGVCAFFAEKPGIRITKRIYYEAEQAPPVFPLPDGFTIRRTDAELLAKLSGRIIPSWSWQSDEQFLANGIGFCIMHGNEIAASAFSATVTAEYIDIGAETMPDYRRKGLAKIAAAAVMQEVLALEKKPCWAHHAANLGSLKTAEALGFLPVRICKAIQIA